MKTWGIGIVVTVFSIITAHAAPADCTLAAGARPACFEARLEPVVRVTLVAYGSKVRMADLLRVEKLFTTRFESSTEGKIRVEIVDRGILDLPAKIRDLTEVRESIRGDESRRELDRLIRIWYYHNLKYEELTDELHAALRDGGFGPALARSDFVLAASGPQFEGIGYADGGMGLVEQPSEIAWGALDGGRTEVNSDEHLVDEFLHEIGHLLGLDHASARCYGDAMTGVQRMQCCRTSPGANDVMSYCRDRSRVRGPYHYRYTSCTKDYLFGTTVPALLQGLKRPAQEKPCD